MREGMGGGEGKRKREEGKSDNRRSLQSSFEASSEQGLVS